MRIIRKRQKFVSLFFFFVVHTLLLMASIFTARAGDKETSIVNSSSERFIFHIFETFRDTIYKILLEFFSFLFFIFFIAVVPIPSFTFLLLLLFLPPRGLNYLHL